MHGNTKHGLADTPVYWAWVNMLKRCRNPAHPYFADYGGRGIKVCERWEKLENFVADMGHPPLGMTLDRKDNDGNYSTENCRWATPIQQMRNFRRNHVVTFEGRSLCIAEWCEILGIRQDTLRFRLKHGWSVERALSTPVRAKSTHKKIP